MFQKRVRPIQQMEATECGVACLAMVLDYHGSSVPLNELRDICGTSRNGNSAVDLLRSAKQLGLDARGLRVDLPRLSQVRLPAILHWNMSHFVVLERFRRGRATLVDPSSGRVRVDGATLNRSFTGVLLELNPTARLQRRRYRSPGQVQYFAHLGTVKASVAFVVVAGVGAQIVGVISPALSQLLIDQVIEPARKSWLLPVLGVLVLAAVTSIVLQRLHEVVMTSLQGVLGVSMTQRLGQHLLRLPLGFVESRSHGDLLQRVYTHGALGGLLTRTVLGVFDAIFALALAALMLAYDATLAALVLSIDVLRLLIIRYLRADSRERAAAGIAASGREHSLLLQVTSSAEMVKGFGLEGELRRWYESRLSDCIRWSVRAARLSAGAGSCLSFFDGCTRALVLWFGGMKVVNSEMTLGVFVGFMTIRALLTGPLASVLGTVEGWIQFQSALARSDDLLQQRAIACGSGDSSGFRGRVELRDVGFRYGSGGPWLLRGVSLRIEPGRHVAIVGPSGQGKSTLLRIMAGVLEPSEGRVLLDGVDIRQYAPQGLARHVGSLVGDPLIFAGSVRNNLTLKLPDADDRAVREAARSACFGQVVARFPDGYEHELEAEGANLSGGERQRLGLAQALLGDPKLLFLDEATCFLDCETEAQVLGNTLRQGITVISVAHRSSVVDAADQVFEVLHGTVRARAAGGLASGLPTTRKVNAVAHSISST